MTRAWLVTLVAIAACGGGQHTDELREACVRVADHDTDLARANVAAVMGSDSEYGPNSPKVTEMTTKIHALVQSRCIADHWSAEIRTCLMRATDYATVQSCNSLFTPEQKQHMLDAAAPMMMPGSAADSR